VLGTEFVRSAARLGALQLVPEICLYQVGDIYELWAQTERELGQSQLPPPFWGVAWPGGLALARYVLDHPALVVGRSVLDFGSGSGLVAIAAAKAGAATVLVSEPDEVARAAIELNAAANGLGPLEFAEDVMAGEPTADVVLAGDVWYEQELAAQVSAFLDRMAASGAVALTGDIGRSYFPRNRYHCLASYEIPVTVPLEGRELVRSAVWQVS